MLTGYTFFDALVYTIDIPWLLTVTQHAVNYFFFRVQKYNRWIHKHTVGPRRDTLKTNLSDSQKCIKVDKIHKNMKHGQRFADLATNCHGVFIENVEFIHVLER